MSLIFSGSHIRTVSHNLLLVFSRSGRNDTIQRHTPCASVVLCIVQAFSLGWIFIASCSVRADLFHASKGRESKRCTGLVFKTVRGIKNICYCHMTDSSSSSCCLKVFQPRVLKGERKRSWLALSCSLPFRCSDWPCTSLQDLGVSGRAAEDAERERRPDSHTGGVEVVETVQRPRKSKSHLFKWYYYYKFCGKSREEDNVKQLLIWNGYPKSTDS